MRIALVGCGAVSQEYYVPALMRVREHPVSCFVDSNIERAKLAARIYGGGETVNDYRDVIHKVDAAIVAVPNFLHCKISTDFLEAGRHVLCEKPLAMNVTEGMAMVRAGENSKARLGVDFIRRRFQNYSMAKEFLGRGMLGKVTNVRYEEGHVVTWPFASSFALEKRQAGGGVLIDWGAHALDILSWILNGEMRAISYKDDGLGRIEVDCEANLVITNRGSDVPCCVRLSRMRELDNSLIIQGDTGSLEVRHFDLNRIYFRAGDHTWQIDQALSSEKSVIDYFAEQVRAFIDGSSEFPRGEEALKVLAITEECYRNRKDISYPWQNRSNASRVGSDTLRSRYRKILIVGASGFLGTNLAERLAMVLKANVRVAIHRPDTAVRLARLPVEYAECDLLKPDQVLRSVEGCDAIINCAKDRSGEKTLDVFVQGTQNLLQAAVSKGVKKYVHVSSAAVSGFQHGSLVTDESASLVHSSSPYIRGKIKSEKLVMAYSDRIPVVILRPTLIYGPFSGDWVVQIINRLESHRVTLIGKRKTANLVFVDDVADAIICALDADQANGSTLVINNDENVVLWNDYIGKLCSLLGISPVTIPEGHRSSFLLRQYARMFVDSMKATNNILHSNEILALIARVPIAVFLGAKIFRGERRKGIESRMISSLEIPKPDPKVVLKYEAIDKGLWEVMTCRTLFSASKARETIGFVPRTSLEEGMRRTADWMEWAGFTKRSKNRQ